uniref:UNC93-like protein n=1 Tax=Angiostrongylus cantonensis TaxID=6313 RepID=A0A0K0D0H2_ANGCA
LIKYLALLCKRHPSFYYSPHHGSQTHVLWVRSRCCSSCFSVLYMSLAISLLFVPTYMIDRFGCKLTLITAMGIYVFYMAVNIRPSYSSLIPASVLAGVAGSCLWGAKCVYITQMGIRYAHLNIESPNTVIVRFFGYFFMIVHSGQVFGLLILSFFKEYDVLDVVNRARAPMFDAPVLKQTLKNCRNTKIMLLVPLTAFNGVERAFLIGIFTKAFVGCGIGVPQIGYVCTAFGISDAICSLVFGPLIKLFGRMPLFVFGAVNNMLMIVTLMVSLYFSTDVKGVTVFLMSSPSMR